MTWIIKLACWWDTCAYGRGEYKTYIGKVDGLDGMDIWDGRVETWDAMGKANQFHTMSDVYLACGARLFIGKSLAVFNLPDCSISPDICISAIF